MIVLLLVAACGELARAELPADYSDAVTIGAKIVWASPGSEIVGFERTHRAIKEMFAAMSDPIYLPLVEGNKFMSQTRHKLERFLDVCEFNVNKCLSVFPAIEALKQEEEDNVVNLRPYLFICEERQRDFCTGNKKDEQTTTPKPKSYKRTKFINGLTSAIKDLRRS